MGLGGSWNPETELGEGRAINTKAYKLAYIENASEANYFELALEFKRGQVNVPQQTPQGVVTFPQEQVMWRITGQGWR